MRLINDPQQFVTRDDRSAAQLVRPGFAVLEPGRLDFEPRLVGDDQDLGRLGLVDQGVDLFKRQVRFAGGHRQNSFSWPPVP